MQWLFGEACGDVRIHRPIAAESCCPELYRMVDLVREALLPAGPLSCAEAAPEAYRRTCEAQHGPNYLAALASTLGISGHLAARALTGNWDGGLLYYLLQCVPKYGRLLRLVYTFNLLRGPHATLGNCLTNAYPDWCRCNRVVTGLNPCAWQWQAPGSPVWHDYPPEALRQIQLAVKEKRHLVRLAKGGRWHRVNLRTLTEFDEATKQRTAKVRSNDTTNVLGFRLLSAPVGYRL